MSTYTEEEAKTKWCPHAVASHMDPRVGFRVGDPTDDPKPHACIASACMAWRFEPQMWRHTSAAGAGTWDEPKEVNGYGRKGQKLPHVGYCGLARKPK